MKINSLIKKNKYYSYIIYILSHFKENRPSIIAGTITAIILAISAIAIISKYPNRDYYDLLSLLATLISIEVGVVALVFAWDVSIKSSKQLTYHSIEEYLANNNMEKKLKNQKK